MALADGSLFGFHARLMVLDGRRGEGVGLGVGLGLLGDPFGCVLFFIFFFFFFRSWYPFLVVLKGNQ